MADKVKENAVQVASTELHKDGIDAQPDNTTVDDAAWDMHFEEHELKGVAEYCMETADMLNGLTEHLMLARRAYERIMLGDCTDETLGTLMYELAALSSDAEDVVQELDQSIADANAVRRFGIHDSLDDDDAVPMGAHSY